MPISFRFRPHLGLERGTAQQKLDAFAREIVASYGDKKFGQRNLIPFRLQSKGIAHLDEIDVFVPDVEVLDLAGPDEFNASDENGKVLRVPVEDGNTVLFVPADAIAKATASNYRSEVAIWYFDDYEDTRLSDDARAALEDAARNAGFDLDESLSTSPFLRAFQRVLIERSEEFTHVISAITGYRIRRYDGKNLQDDPVDNRWVAELDGCRENDKHHYTAAGHGSALDFLGVFGRSKHTVDLPPVNGVDLADPFVQACIVWIDHAPIMSFDESWLIDRREEATGTPSPRKQSPAFEHRR